MGDVQLGIPTWCLPTGVDRETFYLVWRGCSKHNPARRNTRPCCQWNNKRHWKRGGVHSADSHIISFHLADGGFGIYGTCGIHYGQVDAQNGTARKVVHPDADGIRLQRPGHYGNTHHREPQQPHHNGTDYPIYVVQRATAGADTVRRCILPTPRGISAYGALPAGNSCCNSNRKTVETGEVPQGRDSVCDGVATLPLAHTARHIAPYVGEVRTVHKEDRHSDSAVNGCDMVP